MHQVEALGHCCTRQQSLQRCSPGTGVLAGGASLRMQPFLPTQRVCLGRPLRGLLPPMLRLHPRLPHHPSDPHVPDPRKGRRCTPKICLQRCSPGMWVLASGASLRMPHHLPTQRACLRRPLCGLLSPMLHLRHQLLHRPSDPHAPDHPSRNSPQAPGRLSRSCRRG